MNEVAPDSIAQDEPAQDWSELCCGDAVYVSHPKFGLCEAVVDEKTRDSQIVWVIRIGLGRDTSWETGKG